MQPLDGTVSADGQRAGHRILLREEGVAGENPSLTPASDGCNVPKERWSALVSGSVEKEAVAKTRKATQPVVLDNHPEAQAVQSP